MNVQNKSDLSTYFHWQILAKTLGNTWLHAAEARLNVRDFDVADSRPCPQIDDVYVPVQLKAIAREARDVATVRVRDAFGVAGAWITDVHFFSGISTVFSFEVARADAPLLLDALRDAGLDVEPRGADALRAAAAASAAGGDADVPGTLAVTFAHGDPDLKHEVPAVPG